MVASIPSDIIGPIKEEEWTLRQPPQHLVLIGGGHAHIQVIKALAQQHRSPSEVTVTVIDGNAFPTYSGMVPGCIAGDYSVSDISIDLRALCEYGNNMTFVSEYVTDIDFQKRIVYTTSSSNNINNEDDHRTIPFDVLSLDIGSTSRAWNQIPGAREYTIPTRPISNLVTSIRSIVDEDNNNNNNENQPSPKSHSIVIVGGGVAGLELAMTVQSRFPASLTTTTIVDAGTVLLPNESTFVRERLQDIVTTPKGIFVQTDARVESITPTHVVWKPSGNHPSSTKQPGGKIPYTLCLWAAGAAAQPLAFQLQKYRGLKTTPDGWIYVDEYLQTNIPGVFAAGDCAHFSNTHVPKAGVYAVRTGPVLLHNLISYLEASHRGNPPQSLSLQKYIPQDDFLKLLNCGHQYGFGFRFGIPMYGKWVWQLKDYIDRSFMDLFDVSKLPPVSTMGSTGSYETRQYDAYDEDELLLPAPESAAELLQRTDDAVNFLQARLVLRTMSRDDAYKQAVLKNIVVAKELEIARS
jgi:selenide,water dikinase